MESFSLDLYDFSGNRVDHFSSTVLPNIGDVISVCERRYLVTRRDFDVIGGLMSVVGCRITVM